MGWKRADEFMKELARNKRYQEMRRRQDEELERKDREWQREQAPLLADLKECGIKVASVWDLFVLPGIKYDQAIPVLLRHLAYQYCPRNRAGIAYALSTPAAIRAFDDIISFYNKEQNSEVKDALADTIGKLATPANVDRVLPALYDDRNGESRGTIICYLEDLSPELRNQIKELRKLLKGLPERAEDECD